MLRMNGADAFILALETPRAYMHTFKIAILDPANEPEDWCIESYRSTVLSRLNITT